MPFVTNDAAYRFLPSLCHGHMRSRFKRA